MSSVAICIPTYNQAAYLSFAVHSALTQTYPCEVWVSDDASTDETPKIGARLCVDAPSLRYTRHSKNLGISANNNWLLQQPDAEFVARLDSDDYLDPRYIEVLRSALKAHPEAAYAHCAVREIDQYGSVKRIRRVAGQAGFRSADDALRAAARGYRVAANVCLFRKRALEACEFYRAGMNFAEDWDLSVRIAAKGWGNIYVDEVLASYRWWTDGASRTRRKRTEIAGCIEVFEKSLEPAFRQRGWDLQGVTAARQQMARNHADFLLSAVFSAAEKDEMIQLLRQLGGGPDLERHLGVLRSKLGFLIPLSGRFRTWCADHVKATLRLVRR